MAKKGKDSVCIHSGEIKDTQFGGAVSPIFMASSYPFLEVEQRRYPRNFNTPNQEVISRKVAELENAEAGLSFGSGMAAIATSLLAFLKQGDHAIFPNAIYGGAFNFIVKEFPDYGIEYDFTEGLEIKDFQNKIKSNTKVIYIETPSNPLLAITDIKAVASLAKKHGLVSMIDNTFASPLNQTPIDLGIDISIHSATKYLGGHSDILAGVVVGSKAHIDQIRAKGINFGGNLSDFMAYLLERSIKTLGVRIRKHNENAQILAEFLFNEKRIATVYYPGLKTHPGHAIAANQMHGFGGMMSFELNKEIDAVAFQKALKLIKPSMSLAGVESTILMPSLTSHSLMSSKERENIGIAQNLLRFSVGIENPEDIIADLAQALDRVY
ncbi:MAG: PLP-dependent aspartate aminotransferase family protein [Flavobacteriaceae bacterium]|nr:PLP-dependent aspartate aminotransferase family protein [Flavobacteriaceae bacterium]